jgi:hypothetical protein
VWIMKPHLLQERSIEEYIKPTHLLPYIRRHHCVQIHISFDQKSRYIAVKKTHKSAKSTKKKRTGKA